MLSSTARLVGRTQTVLWSLAAMHSKPVCCIVCVYTCVRTHHMLQQPGQPHSVASGVVVWQGAAGSRTGPRNQSFVLSQQRCHSGADTRCNKGCPGYSRLAGFLDTLSAVTGTVSFRFFCPNYAATVSKPAELPPSPPACCHSMWQQQALVGVPKLPSLAAAAVLQSVPMAPVAALCFAGCLLFCQPGSATPWPGRQRPHDTSSFNRLPCRGDTWTMMC